MAEQVRLCVQSHHPIDTGNYPGPIHCTAHPEGTGCVTVLYERAITDDPTPRCTNGWGPGGCSYTGGCYCERKADHAGRCRCVCGRTRKQEADHGSDDG